MTLSLFETSRDSPSVSNEELESQHDDDPRWSRWMEEAAKIFEEPRQGEECRKTPYASTLCSTPQVSSRSALSPTKYTDCGSGGMDDDSSSESESDSEDDKSDSGSDSDVESMALDQNYVVVDDHAYRTENVSEVSEIVDMPFIPPVKSTPTSKRVVGTNIKATVLSSPSLPSAVTRPRVFRRSSRSYIPPTSVAIDTDGESDDDNTDDEYVPSPRLNPRKRRAPSSTSKCKRQKTSSAVAPRVSSTASDSLVKRTRPSVPSRNRQTSSPAIIRSMLEQTSGERGNVCPECGWRKEGRRSPDFTRHLQSHIRSSEEEQNGGWWCMGVPEADAANYSIPEGAKRFSISNVWRIGGCQKSFSRRDALIRHVKNKNGRCIVEKSSTSSRV